MHFLRRVSALRGIGRPPADGLRRSDLVVELDSHSPEGLNEERKSICGRGRDAGHYGHFEYLHRGPDTEPRERHSTGALVPHWMGLALDLRWSRRIGGLWP